MTYIDVVILYVILSGCFIAGVILRAIWRVIQKAVSAGLDATAEHLR